MLAARLRLHLAVDQGGVAGAQGGLDPAVEFPAMGGIQRVVGPIQRQPRQAGQQRQLASEPDALPVHQPLFGVVAVVGGQAVGEERGLGEAVLQVDVGPDVLFLEGVGVVLVGGRPDPQGVLRAAPVRQGEFGVDALENPRVLGRQGDGVGAAQAIVDRQPAVHAGAFAGGIAAAQGDCRRRAVRQADDHRSQALGVGRGRQRDCHRVVHAGVEQPPFQFGDRVRRVDLPGLPRRQIGHPLGIGAARGLHLHAAELHARARCDLERRRHRPVGVIDRHLAWLRLGVRIAGLLHGADDAPFGGDHVRGPPRRAGLQFDGRHRVGLHLRLGRGARPRDARRGDDGPGAGIDADDRLGWVAVAEVGRDHIVVVAFGAQNDGGVIAGLLGASPRLEPTARAPFGRAHVMLDGLTQGLVADAGHRRLCLVGHDRS